MARGHLTYRVGNEENPGDPFGRSLLEVAPDGSARLDHFARGGIKRAWSGRVEAAALERLWAALDRAGFPQVPKHPIVGGATMRGLTVGDRRAMVEWHAARKLAGYDEAFGLLDTIVRQLSQDIVKRTPAAGEAIVRDVSVA